MLMAACLSDCVLPVSREVERRKDEQPAPRESAYREAVGYRDRAAHVCVACNDILARENGQDRGG